MEDVNKRAQDLQAQVLQLQTKLHEVHSTDINTLRRSFRSISQHIHALKHEATALESLVQSLEPELYPPEYIAEQVAQVGVVTGTVYGACKLLKDVPMAPKARAWLRSSLVMAAVVLISWRLAAGSVARFAKALREHRGRRRHLLQEWDALKQRIDMLLALSGSAGPFLGEGSTSGSSSSHGSREGLATAPAGGSTAGGSTTGELPGGSTGTAGGNGGFVVLDLPRVDSYPGWSRVSSPAPPGERLGGANSPPHPGGAASSAPTPSLGSTSSGEASPDEAPAASTTVPPATAFSGTTVPHGHTAAPQDTSGGVSAAHGAPSSTGDQEAGGTSSTTAAANAAAGPAGQLGRLQPSNTFSSGWGGVAARPQVPPGVLAAAAGFVQAGGGSQPPGGGALESAGSGDSDADWVQAANSPVFPQGQHHQAPGASRQQ